MPTTTATDATFDQLIQGADKPVLVDYWAEWCHPCKQIAPILEQISDEYGDKIDVVKVNIDENPQVGGSSGVTSIPTLHVYKNGEVVKAIVGAKPKPALLRDLEEFIQ